MLSCSTTHQSRPFRTTKPRAAGLKSTHLAIKPPRRATSCSPTHSALQELSVDISSNATGSVQNIPRTLLSRILWQPLRRSCLGITSFTHLRGRGAAAPAASRAYVSNSTAVLDSTSDWPPVPPEHRGLTYLQELRVQDFALISSARVPFTPGLNGISGQSGAGKSVLLAALQQLVGAAAEPGSVRHPAEMAVVEGRWWLEQHMCARITDAMRTASMPDKALPTAGGDVHGAGGYLHIKREITKSEQNYTRSRVTVNGCPSSLRVLRVLGALLLDINAQHASVALRDNHQQLSLLDKIAGTTDLVVCLSSHVSRLSELEGLLSDADALADEDERRTLQKQVEVIDRAQLTPGEEVSLRRRLSALESRRSSLEIAALAQAGIQSDTGGGQSLLDAVRLVTTQIRGVLANEQQQQKQLIAERQQQKPTADGGNIDSSGAARLQGDSGRGSQSRPSSRYPAGSLDTDSQHDDVHDDPEVQSATAAIKKLEAAMEELEAMAECCYEASSQLTMYATVAGYSASESSRVSARLEEVTRLCKKFRARDTTQLLDLADEWSNQLEAYYESVDRQEEWRAESATLQQQITELALQLSAARQAAAAELSEAVERCLGQLAMNSSRFVVDMKWQKSNQVEPSSRAVSAPTATEPSHKQQQDSNLSHTSSSGSADTNCCLYRLSPTGLDHVQFMLSAGPAEPLRPLAAVASGGEAARIMLALKAAPAAAATATGACGVSQQQVTGVVRIQQQGPEQQQGQHSGPGLGLGPPVVLMDETDAGVGSRLGSTVGQLLRSMVEGNSPAAQQLIVVSHTPQVAAQASHHIKVSKSTSADSQRVMTTFEVLSSPDARQAELADMMGRPGHSHALEFAADMLAQAHGVEMREQLQAAAEDREAVVAAGKLLLGLSAAAAAAGAAADDNSDGASNSH